MDKCWFALEKVYKRYKERKAQRRKASVSLLILLILLILLGVLINSTIRWFFGYWFLLGMFIFAVGFTYTLSRSWVTEIIETSIAVEMYEASEVLELCSGEEEESNLYLGKAVTLVKEAIANLDSLCDHLDQKKSNLFNREFAEPLIRLKENLESRILPRISQGKDTPLMIHVLRGLAQLFGEIQKPVSLDAIISKNKDLEHYEEVSLRETTLTDALKPIVSSKPSIFLFSIFSGYFSSTVIVWVACQLWGMNFVDIMQKNLFGWASLGAGLTGAIIALIVLKR